MAYKVVWEESAKRDVAETVEYLLEELCSRQAATNLLDKLERKRSIISVFPDSYPLAADPYLRRREYRSARADGYLVLYRVAERWVTMKDDEIVEHAGIGGCEGIVRISLLRHVREDWEERL